MLFGRHIVELNTPNNTLVRSYVWGLDLSGTMAGAGGVGGLLWVTLHTASGAAPGTHFCAYDGNGNIVALSAASDGSETARYEYGPFGEPIRVTGPAANQNPFRFSTKRTCNTTDLVLYEYRAYSPALGRWLSRDPLRERAGRNLFGFVGNSPLGYLDPWGLKWRKMNCIAISVVGGGSAYRWVGVSIRAEVRAETCDCCDDETGETRPRDYRKISGTAKGSAGLGFGAEVELPIVGEVGWVIKGPQVSGSATLSWCKACGDKAPPEVTLEFLKNFWRVRRVIFNWWWVGWQNRVVGQLRIWPLRDPRWSLSVGGIPIWWTWRRASHNHYPGGRVEFPVLTLRRSRERGSGAPGLLERVPSEDQLQEMPELPLIVFLLSLMPLLWVMFQCARLGQLLKKNRFTTRQRLGSGKHFWSHLFTLVPEAKPCVKRILIGLGITVLWWAIVMLVTWFILSLFHH